MVLIGIMDGYNIRVREPGDESSLQVEAFNEVSVCSKPWWKNLDRDFAVKVLLVRSIDARHASLAELSQYFIVPKRHTDQVVLLHDILWAKKLYKYAPRPSSSSSFRSIKYASIANANAWRKLGRFALAVFYPPPGEDRSDIY